MVKKWCQVTNISFQRQRDGKRVFIGAFQLVHNESA